MTTLKKPQKTERWARVVRVLRRIFLHPGTVGFSPTAPGALAAGQIYAASRGIPALEPVDDTPRPPSMQAAGGAHGHDQRCLQSPC